MPLASPSSPLPSIGPLMSGWSPSSPFSNRRSSMRDKRQQKLGLWSAVALQQHLASTGGQRGRPLPSIASCSTEAQEAQLTGAARGSFAAVGATADGAVETMGATTEDLRTFLGPAGSLPGHPHKPTLAQRMGLVPAPPPEPSAEDWQAVVQRAMLREQQSHYGDSSTHVASVCSICQMSFLSTSDEGQVILSCSHVFHAQCFHAFERCVRAQQRADGAGLAEVTAQLACPVCRTQHYYKRVFYEGKAMAQRAAIVKVQAAIRGFLARRRYVQRRLRSNADFRTRYVQERLSRLSAAWSAFCAQQERQRETTLVALAVQHQAATAAYLTVEEWEAIWQAALKREAESSSSYGGGGGRLGVLGVLQCPICLEDIHETFFTQRRRETEASGTQASGEEFLTALRAAYEKRTQAAAGVKTGVSRSRNAEVALTQGGKRAHLADSIKGPNACKAAIKSGVATKPKTHSQARFPSSQPIRDLSDCLPTAATTTLPPLTPASALQKNTLASGPRSGVLLSCGHCFHTACISCYERYNEQRITEMAGSSQTATCIVVADRCPICRAGYAKHAL